MLDPEDHARTIAWSVTAISTWRLTITGRIARGHRRCAPLPALRGEGVPAPMRSVPGAPSPGPLMTSFALSIYRNVK